MSNPIRTLIDAIERGKQALITNRENDVLRIATDQIALIKLRIQQQGLDFQNLAFPPYTPAYARQRKKAGYQVGYVDLTRTGRTLASVLPRITESSIFGATVIIESGTTEGKKIIEGLEKKRPGIYVSTPEEIELVREANRNRIQDYFKF